MKKTKKQKKNPETMFINMIDQMNVETNNTESEDLRKVCVEDRRIMQQVNVRVSINVPHIYI
jgi:phage terminase small subunit